MNSSIQRILIIAIVVSPELAFAADLEGTLRNLVAAFTGRILPIVALGYLGKNIFSHIQGDPNARHETIRVVIAIACLIGLNGVWSYIAQQAR
jgi:hypothetical protein